MQGWEVVRLVTLITSLFVFPSLSNDEVDVLCDLYHSLGVLSWNSFSLLLAFSLLLHTRWSFLHRGQCSFNVRIRYSNKPLTLDRAINFNTSGGTLPSSIGNFTKITSM